MSEIEIPAADLLGNADGNIEKMIKTIRSQHKIASNHDLPIEERLEAYEDIIDSEVGDTDLIRARNIERETGVRQIFLKFEGGNPTGTQKDRIAFSQAKDALRRGFSGIAIATCGNYGVAMATATSLAGLDCIIHLPKGYQTKRITEMQRLGAKIIRVEGDYEKSVEVSQKFAEDNEIYDANPGGANTILQLNSYGKIAYEIYDELRDAPWAIAIPVSNGTTLAGIYKGFVSLYRRGKTSRIPRIVAGSSYRKNPIISAFINGRDECRNLQPEKIRETKINEPLINWHSIDGEHALSAIRESQGWAVDVSDKNMLSFARMIREKQGLDVLPASTVGLSALLKSRNVSLPRDRFVAVLTGRKS